MANYRRELRMEIDIKRKNRKDNRVCGENEENTRRSRSSIKKGIGRDKKTSR